MRKKGNGAILAWALVIFATATGCGRFPVSTTKGGTPSTAPVTLTLHDAPASGVAVTSFSATITGVALNPGNVSLLSAPQTVELTQLQTNSVYLVTKSITAPANFTSLTISYSNPRYTILNDTGVSITAAGTTCSAGQSCVITPSTSNVLTNTISTSLAVAADQPTLIEVDVNLDNIVQSNYSVDFSQSGAISLNQLPAGQTSSPIDTLSVSGEVSSVGSNQFSLAASTGQQLTIPVNSSTQYFQFDEALRNASCAANDFSCIQTGQILSANLNILGDGTYLATEVDFDDAASTQQVAGTIVGLTGSPPSSFQMVVQNTVPSLASAAIGTPVTVTLSAAPTFLINTGSFVLPSSVPLSFATSTDLLIGQEVEARVSGSVSAGPPVSFTADRIALDQSQLNAAIFSLNQGNLSFFVNGLPALFSAPIIQIQAYTTNQTVFETSPTGSFTDLTVSPPNNVVFMGGFLFNSSNPQIPNLAAVTVRSPIPGT